MSTIYKTKIGAYDVELEVGIDDDPSTQCFVEHKRFSASLAALCSMGTLINGDGVIVHTVQPSIIDVIEEWALARGY